MVKEQRKHTRHLADVVVSYRDASPGLLAPDQGEGVIENISLGGLFLTTDEPLPIGTSVDLKFDVRDAPGHGKVEARAVVKWNRSRFRPLGMGLEFTEFVHGRGALEHWLNDMGKLQRR